MPSELDDRPLDRCCLLLGGGGGGARLTGGESLALFDLSVRGWSHQMAGVERN